MRYRRHRKRRDAATVKRGLCRKKEKSSATFAQLMSEEKKCGKKKKSIWQAWEKGNPGERGKIILKKVSS